MLILHGYQYAWNDLFNIRDSLFNLKIEDWYDWTLASGASEILKVLPLKTLVSVLCFVHKLTYLSTCRHLVKWGPCK